MINGKFEASDCIPSSFFTEDYRGRVLVLAPGSLRDNMRGEYGQLWLGLDGSGCDLSSAKGMLTAVRLADGKTSQWRRGKFYGVIAPKLLPEWARQKLEMLPPVSERAKEWNNLVGYCPGADGSAGEGMPLADWREALNYIRVQMPYQNRIEIADTSTDYIVATIEGGQCRMHVDNLFKLADELQTPLTQEPDERAGLELDR